MDIQAALKKAEATLRSVKAQEKKTLRAVSQFGKDVQDKARESFRKAIAESVSRVEESANESQE
jgi:CHASE3 domain sensor protein